jgi:transposase
MKITRRVATVDTTNKMTVAFDISKKNVNYYAEVRGRLSGTDCHEVEVLQGDARNGHASLTHLLGELVAYAAEHGYEGLHVVCEPTGHYSDALLRVSRQLGHTTGLISGEKVNKAKVLENNDNSKDDIKDPRVILMLSKMGKEQQYRTLPPLYQALRELNRIHDSASDWRTQKRCELTALIERLFCDYERSREFVVGVSARALMEAYGFNPYRMVLHSYSQFCRRVRRFSPRTTDKTLRELYDTAKTSVLNLQAPEHIAAIEQRLRTVWDDFWTAHERREKVREQMTEIYWKLYHRGDMVPVTDNRVWSPSRIGRMLAETGPLSDFGSWRMLQRYAGANLRTRESGKYKGKMRTSKKGRIPIRHVTGSIAFGLIRQDQVYGPYAQQRRDANRPGKWLIANVARKLLRMFFALSRRREQFCEQRLPVCESQYQLAA